MKRTVATGLAFLLMLTLLRYETMGDFCASWRTSSLNLQFSTYDNGDVPSTVPMRIGVLYDDQSPLSLHFSRYVKWLFNTMWKIPVDLINTRETGLSRQLFFDGSTPRYSMIFLTNIIDGENRLPPLAWRIILDDLNQLIPIVTGLHAVSISEASELFGCEIPEDKDVKIASVTSDLLTEDIPETLYLWRSVVTSTLKGGKGLIRDSGVGPNEGALLVVNEMNVWFGFKDFSYPSPSRGPLTLIFYNLLRMIPQGFVRLKIPHTFVALRIDDIPFSTESWFHGWQYFTANGWRRFFEVLAEHDAKCDLLIIPYNVSKDTSLMVPYNVTHGDVLESIKEGIEIGVVEIGCHGATHVNPIVDYFVNSTATDPWELTALIRFEFGYDPHTGQRIPRELQELHLNMSTQILEEWFGFRPILFTPPWHVWDNTTESILEDLGYKFISADFRLYEDGVRPPSILGERSSVSNLFEVSMTYDWDSLSLDPQVMSSILKPQVKAGIPIVFLSHGRNWSSIDFTISENDARFGRLDELFEPRYATITEIGDFLITWSALRMEAVIDGDVIRMNLTSPVDVPVKIEAWKASHQVTQVLYNNTYIKPEGNEVSIDLVNGSSTIRVEFQKVEGPSWLSNPFVLYGSIATILLATVCTVIILKRRTRRRYYASRFSRGYTWFSEPSFRDPRSLSSDLGSYYG